ncbi:MAG: hypothetical protein WA982_09920, partial [Rubrobacteraceae bacterium]
MELKDRMRSAAAGLLDAGLAYPVQPTEYDTAWAARLTGDDGTPAYPHLIDWLIERQHEDGSWGGQIPYLPDRLLSTLAVTVMLARLEDPGYTDPLARGERYLKQNLRYLEDEIDRPVGFELILPALFTEARDLGMDLSYNSLPEYELERDEKLSLLPMDRLFSTQTTALFSLEAFGDNFDAESVANLLLKDG